MELDSIDLKAVRDRLRSADLFLSVSDVESAGAAMETAAKTPAAFVAISSESATPNNTLGVHSQQVSVTLSVLICVAAQRADQERADKADQLRKGTIAALAGWTPAGARKALDYAGYRVVRIDGGLIWLECSFATGWALRLP